MWQTMLVVLNNSLWQPVGSLRAFLILCTVRVERHVGKVLNPSKVASPENAIQPFECIITRGFSQPR
jgi:hypothetical protein